MRTELEIRLATLRVQFPGWEFWHVRVLYGPDVWCAKPLGCDDFRQVLNAHSAGELAELISETEGNRDERGDSPARTAPGAHDLPGSGGPGRTGDAGAAAEDAAAPRLRIVRQP